MLLLSTYQTLPNLAFCLSSNKRIKTETYKALEKIFSSGSNSSNTKFLGGDSSVTARARMKSSASLSKNYECETSPKHKIYIIKFKTKT